jgi:hypothetical protein
MLIVDVVVAVPYCDSWKLWGWQYGREVSRRDLTDPVKIMGIGRDYLAFAFIFA